MGENTYASVAQRVDPTRHSDKVNKYRALVEKVIQLEPNNGPKFQKHLTKLHSADFQQTQTEQKEVSNKENSNEVVQGKKHKESAA